MAFLARMEGYAKCTSLSKVWASDGTIILSDPWSHVQVADFGADKALGYYVKERFLRNLRAAKGEATLTVGDKGPELSLDGMTMHAGGGLDDAPVLPNPERFWKIEDIATFAESLKECVKVTSKDDARPNMATVYLDGGELLSTDGTRMAVRYAGDMGANAKIPVDLARRWVMMLTAFAKSKGAWYLAQTPGDGEKTFDQVALIFRHFGQEVRVMGQETRPTEGSTFGAHTLRKLLKEKAEDHGSMLTGDVADFTSMFDFVAVYSNGEVVGWMEGDPDNNHGQSGLIPLGEKPLGIFKGDLLKDILPKGKRGQTPRRWVRFGDPMKGDDALSVYGSITIGDGVLMGRKPKCLPALPADAYDCPAAVKAA